MIAPSDQIHREREMAVLIARVEWMENYDGNDLGWGKVGGYARSGETVAEAWNFRVADDGFVYGYARVPSDGDINAKRFSSGNPNGEPTIVVFTAKPDPKSPWVIVGWYKDPSTIQGKYKYPDRIEFFGLKARRVGFSFKVRPENVALLPVDERVFQCSYQGRSQIRYLGSDASKEIREYIKSVEGGVTSLMNPQAMTMGEEGRKARAAIRMERSSKAGKWLHTIALPSCEACGVTHDLNRHPALRARFEVHHKKEINLLKDGEMRELDSRDLAVLCANCHRAIHRTEFSGDIAKFRDEILRGCL